MKELLEEIGDTAILKEVNAKSDYIALNFDNFKLKILPETYQEFKFFVGKKYKKEQIEKCILEDYKNEIIRYGYNKFGNKNYCNFEIKKKIDKKFDGYPEEVINNAIKVLKENGVIDDKKYVTQSLEYFNVGCYGKYYIINFFKSKNIDSEIINSIVFDDELERQKAQTYFELIKNKYVSNNFVKQKKKIYENLLRRGFDVSLISEIVDLLKIDEEKEEKSLIKSYFKEKNKLLSKKTLDKPISNILISKLVGKGYSFEKVKELVTKDELGELKND